MMQFGNRFLKNAPFDLEFLAVLEPRFALNKDSQILFYCSRQ